jgi:mannitol/fructose-specific phosphotransferase system IIA component (Ntr-type)
MHVVARLSPDLIRIAPPWRTLPDTIAGLVRSLAASGALPADREREAVEFVMRRESEATTALLDIGAGVPHARFPGLEEPVVSLAVSAAGLYEAVPTVSIRIVALVLSPPEARAEHLEILAGLATLLRSSTLRARLLAARDGAEALAALHAHTRPQY